VERGITGHYEVTKAGGEEVRAFVPHPLPPEPPLELTGARQRLLEKSTLALGRLDSITTQLPDPQLFLYAYVRREAVLSSQIEGTQSSLSDLLLFELEEAPGALFDDVVDVSNYVAALEHGIARLHERPVLTLKEVSRRTTLTFPTAAKGMMALVALGIARELTGNRRNRVFAYDRYLAVLGEGTEPL
jgi:Fic family protein